MANTRLFTVNHACLHLLMLLLCSLRVPNFQVQRLPQKLVNLLKTRTCRNCGNRERERVHRTAECSKVVLKTSIHTVIKTLQSRHSTNLQYSPETKTSSEAFEKTASSWPKSSRTNKNLNSDLEHERSTSSEPESGQRILTGRSRSWILSLNQITSELIETAALPRLWKTVATYMVPVEMIFLNSKTAILDVLDQLLLLPFCSTVSRFLEL